METQDLGTLGFELKDKIKLVKNSKGYNWEISILSLDINELERLNAEMIKRFGDNTSWKRKGNQDADIAGAIRL